MHHPVETVYHAMPSYTTVEPHYEVVHSQPVVHYEAPHYTAPSYEGPHYETSHAEPVHYTVREHRDDRFHDLPIEQWMTYEHGERAAHHDDYYRHH
mmetsp:Transcript_8526/g.9938  ORF Transcript_8526/g.9938 Transcript_8526/m.9938 type:complete len:96 (-) Transcript_8526:717-1004(-)